MEHVMFDTALGKTVPKRRVRREVWRKNRGSLEDWREHWRIPGSRKPFKALQAYSPKLATALALPESQQRAALEALGPLLHRGHGSRHPGRQRSVLGCAMANRSVY